MCIVIGFGKVALSIIVSKDDAWAFLSIGLG